MKYGVSGIQMVNNQYSCLKLVTRENHNYTLPNICRVFVFPKNMLSVTIEFVYIPSSIFFQLLYTNLIICYI